MAIVKISFIKHAQNAVNYVLRERGPNDLVDAEGVLPEEAAHQFKETAKLYQGKGAVQAIHIVQSWNEAESKLFPPSTFQEMGKKLMEAKFPGHDFLIVTHTDTGKTHNHIILNPWHGETGKKIENKKYHLYQLRDANDKICKEKGLSVIDGKAKDRAARLPDKVQRMVRFNGKSYLMDIMQKADFARAYSTNYDQYTALLGELNVYADVQNKNITYHYPGHTQGKRGSKLGKLYDKEGLEKAFSLNKEKFAEHPNLASKIRGGIENLKTDPKNISQIGKELEGSTQGHFQVGFRDLKVFDKGTIKSDRFVHPSEKELKGSLIPMDEIIKARRHSILQYCEKNKIGLEKHSESQWRLKDRPHVLLGEHEWTNTKNKTRGSLIDFVAVHKDMTFLQAIAHINNNPRLLLLEKHFGQEKRTFTSFYVPKSEKMEASKAMGRVSHWLRSFGGSDHSAGSLLSRQLIQVHQSGSLRLFADKDESSAFEFKMDGDGHWQSKKLGAFQSPFLTKNGSGKKAVVFLDPFSALKQKDLDLFSDRKSDTFVIALMEPNHSVLDQFIGKNSHIKHLDLVPSKSAKPSAMEIDFFETLKGKAKSLDISVAWASLEKGLSKSGPDLPGFDF